MQLKQIRQRFHTIGAEWETECEQYSIEESFLQNSLYSFEVWGPGTADFNQEGSSFRISEYGSQQRAFKAAKNYLENLVKELKP